MVRWRGGEGRGGWEDCYKNDGNVQVLENATCLLFEVKPASP